MRSYPWLVRRRRRRTGGGRGRCPELLSERPVPGASRWCYNLEPRISSVLTGRQCLCAGVWRWCAWDGNSYSQPSHISRDYSLRWRGRASDTQWEDWWVVWREIRLLYHMLMMLLHIPVWHILYVNGAYFQHISSQGLSETIQRISKKNSIRMQLFALQDLSQSSILYCLKYEISFYKKTNNTIRSLQIDSFNLKIILFIGIGSVMMLVIML